MLSSFVLTVKKDNGDDYEPGTLSSIVYSLDRHLQRSRYVISLVAPILKTFMTAWPQNVSNLRVKGKADFPTRPNPLQLMKRKAYGILVSWERTIQNPS